MLNIDGTKWGYCSVSTLAALTPPDDEQWSRESPTPLFQSPLIPRNGGCCTCILEPLSISRLLPRAYRGRGGEEAEEIKIGKLENDWVWI